ncbi:MAG: exodeoxyribonuclease VII small subunit [Thermoanaerobaculales bacterium]|jgi:exodeoxyribonuclease VII small subunit|nr:exodeoxyribonuclease VII small subunit [Thermoanaerobaculales bacterium]
MAPSENETGGERFEDQLERLEEIVASLEDETVGLEEALDLFEDGMKLARSCRARLEEVEQRVQQLLATEDDDVARTAPLATDDGTEDEPER